jgi:hypothetical protein
MNDTASDSGVKKVPVSEADAESAFRSRIFFFRFFLAALPMVELNSYISTHPEIKVKHRLNGRPETSLVSVNSEKQAL